MPNPSRNWTITANNNLGGTYPLQWQRACFQLIDAMRLAGWTVVQSSNGTTAGAGDNITTEANWIQNTTALGGSWAVLSSPAGWLDNSGVVYFLYYANVAAADTTPNPLHYFHSTTNWAINGTTTALPTNPGFVTTTTNKEIVSWTSYVPATYIKCYTDRGDVRLLCKQNGQPFISNIWDISSNVVGDGDGRGDLQYWQYNEGSNGEVLANAGWTGTTNFRGLRRDGLAQESSIRTFADVWTVGWTNGLDDFGELNYEQLRIWQTSSDSDGRFKGHIVDTYAVPPNIVNGTLDDSESAQTYRRVVYGDVAIYLPTAALPLT